MSAPPAELDARGLLCPWPALRLARLMRDEASVLIHTDDPAAPGELRALAAARGWRIDASDEAGPGSFRVDRD